MMTMDVVSARFLLLALGVCLFHTATTSAWNVTNKPPDVASTDQSTQSLVISTSESSSVEEKGKKVSTKLTTVLNEKSRNVSDELPIMDITTEHLGPSESFETSLGTSVQSTDTFPPDIRTIISGLKMFNSTTETTQATLGQVHLNSTVRRTAEVLSQHNDTVNEPVIPWAHQLIADNANANVKNHSTSDEMELSRQNVNSKSQNVSLLNTEEDGAYSVFENNTTPNTQVGRGTSTDVDQHDGGLSTSTPKYHNTTQVISNSDTQFSKTETKANNNDTHRESNTMESSVIYSNGCDNINNSLCRNASRSHDKLRPETNATVTEKISYTNESLLSRLIFDTRDNKTFFRDLIEHDNVTQSEQFVNNSNSFVLKNTSKHRTTLSPSGSSDEGNKPMVVTYKVDGQHQYNGVIQTLLLDGLKHETWENQVPIEDGPFGSLIWRDKKYLISVLVPIGVGITGAVVIVVVAYVVRSYKRKQKRRAFTSPSRIFRPQAQLAIMDQVLLLDDSSDDEF